jgi:hypothetical protein
MTCAANAQNEALCLELQVLLNRIMLMSSREAVEIITHLKGILELLLSDKALEVLEGE